MLFNIFLTEFAFIREYSAFYMLYRKNFSFLSFVYADQDPVCMVEKQVWKVLFSVAIQQENFSDAAYQNCIMILYAIINI